MRDALGQTRFFGHDRDGSAVDRLLNEAVAIQDLAADGNEQTVRTRIPGVVTQRGDSPIQRPGHNRVPELTNQLFQFHTLSINHDFGAWKQLSCFRRRNLAEWSARLAANRDSLPPFWRSWQKSGRLPFPQTLCLFS